MNKAILLGRLTRNPELRYSQSANPIAIARYGIAVRRQFAKQGEQDVDFFNIVAFGKAAEFASKYFAKGQMIAISGRLQINQYEDKENVKRTSIDVIVEEQHFTGGKNDSSASDSPGIKNQEADTEDDSDELPF